MISQIIIVIGNATAVPAVHHRRVVCLAANIMGDVIASIIDGIKAMMSKILRTKTVVFIYFRLSFDELKGKNNYLIQHSKP